MRPSLFGSLVLASVAIVAVCLLAPIGLTIYLARAIDGAYDD